MARTRKKKDSAARRQAFEGVMDDRLRKYVTKLGGLTKAAEASGLPITTISGWLRPSPSIPRVDQLFRVAGVLNRSMDWLCGRDVPETVGEFYHLERRLGDELRAYMVDRLVARGVPREIAEAQLFPPQRLLDDLVLKAHEFAFKAAAAEELEKLAMEKVRADWQQRDREEEEREVAEVQKLIAEQTDSRPTESGRRKKK
jgi:transcriptional regulator with XRE-family HTH domain